MDKILRRNRSHANINVNVEFRRVGDRLARLRVSAANDPDALRGQALAQIPQDVQR
jgi:hypothetical protein